tara:strand:- start:61 stop:1119 length:1059 start_codon:yes stop_codon:yes gene_type:complete
MAGQITIDSANFKFNVIGKQTPICADCELDEEESASLNGPTRFAQYEVDDIRSIWCRVLCVNRHPTKQFPGSLLGPTGHIERMNVWTHLFAAVVYLLHASIRPSIYGDEMASLTNTLVTVDSVCLVATYVISSTYHVYSANYFWSAVTRLGDYAGIYLSIASGYLVDLSVATVNLTGVPWQSVADLWIAMAAMVLFFVVRRTQLGIDETRLPYLQDRCTLGLARSTNVDLEHSSLRAAAGSIMILSWILTMPGAFHNLESGDAVVFLVTHIIGTAILVSGMVLDNVFLYPDTWFKTKGAAPTRCVCYSKREGCGGGWIMNSHALWHLIAFFSTVSSTIGLEYIVSRSEVFAA